MAKRVVDQSPYLGGVSSTSATSGGTAQSRPHRTGLARRSTSTAGIATVSATDRPETGTGDGPATASATASAVTSTATTTCGHHRTPRVWAGDRGVDAGRSGA